MSDEELDVRVQSALAGLLDKDFEEIRRDVPGGLRPIYEERQNAP